MLEDGCQAGTLAKCRLGVHLLVQQRPVRQVRAPAQAQQQQQQEALAEEYLTHLPCPRRQVRKVEAGQRAQ